MGVPYRVAKAPLQRNLFAHKKLTHIVQASIIWANKYTFIGTLVAYYFCVLFL